MAHVIIRGNNGRRHEVDFEEAGITVELHASSDHVELVIEAPHDAVPSDKKRFALANIPRHLFSKAEVVEHDRPWRGKKDFELATLD